MNTDMRARQNRAALIGALVLLLVAGYWGFIALDSWGLSEQSASAVVRGKRYQPAGTTYVTQMINNRATQVPQRTAEAFLLQLDVAGEPPGWAGPDAVEVVSALFGPYLA